MTEDADPFANIVDDVEARNAARSWAFDELRAGRPPEHVAADLIANGWSRDDAVEIAEEARKRTRHFRGVVTRDDVAEAVATDNRGNHGSIMHGYIAPPASFESQAEPPTPAGSVLQYEQIDPGQLRRLRDARRHALIWMVGGAGVFLLGLVLLKAVLSSSQERESLTSYLLVAGLLLIGGMAFVLNLIEFRSPSRLVGKLPRGPLDKPR